MTTSDREPFAPTLLSQSDVEQMWRTVMRPLGWRQRALWFFLVTPDDRPLPRICEIAELPDEVDEQGHAAAAQLWCDLVADIVPGGRVALLMVRPGVGGPTPVDRALAEGLYSACRRAGVPLEVIHLATDEEIWALPADEVVTRSA